MASPPVIEEQSHNSHRAKVRIGVAAVLLITAIGILTVLNQRRTEEPAAPPPAAQTSMSSADEETPPATPPNPELPAAVPADAAMAAVTPPPPPPVPGKLPETTVVAPKPSAPGAEEESEGVYAATAASPPMQGSLPAAPSSQPQVQPAVPAASKAYAVQLGVFSDPDNAKQLQSKLAQHGIPSRTETRVQIGPFKTRAEADRAKEKLKALGMTAVVLDK